MPNWHRRTVLATGAALSSGIGLASSSTGESTAVDGDDKEYSAAEEAPRQDVDVEYVYALAENAIGDDRHVEERLEMSSGEYSLTEHEDSRDFCVVSFEVENLTDDEDLTVYFQGSVDGNATYERPTTLEAGESRSLSLESDECPTDPDQVTIRAWVPYVEGPFERREDDDSADEAENPSDGLELSVSAPDSIASEAVAQPDDDAADFCITVTNPGNEPVSAEVTLEIGPIDEPVFVDLGPGEDETVRFGVMSRDFEPGEHEWTVTANGETETGTLTMTNDAEC